MRSQNLVSNNWATPQAFFKKWDDIYHFTIDAAASVENTKCLLFYNEQINALEQDWFGDANKNNVAPTVWLNPPYTKIKTWVKKAYEESLKGCTVVMLLPAGTDTGWFHDYVVPHAKLEFVRGRLKFENAKGSAMSPSIVVVFEPPFQSDSI